MPDMTAFANVRSPLRSTGLASVAAIRMGEEDQRIEEDRDFEKENRLIGQQAFSAWSKGQTQNFQKAIGVLSTRDPDAAAKMNLIFGDLDRTNFVESAFHVYNAARSTDPAAQDAALDKALDVLGTQPDHPMALSLQEIRSMPNETKEEKTAKLAKIFQAVDMADQWNAYPREKDMRSAAAKAPTATDVDDYVRRANEESIRLYGKPLTPGKQNEAALEYKRAQESEVRKTRLALRGADAATAELIKRNEELGKAMATIATAGAVLEAKGEITPQQKISKAKARMSGSLVELVNHYKDLSTMGAIINTDKDALDNIFAATRSSTAGQAIGRVFGTKPQSVRAKINKLIPLIVQDIRQSTDMSARGLDSEKELEFYMQAATDPKTDLQSNYAAIAVLDEAYGDGKIAEQLRAQSGLIDMKALDAIKAEGNRILQGTTKQYTQQNPAKPMTEEEFNALPPGSHFIDPDDGQLYVK